MAVPAAIDLIRESQGQARTTASQGIAADAALQDFLDDASDMGAKRLEEFARFEEFYEGEHGVELTDRAAEFLQVKGIPFTENFCEPLVDMVGERLQVTGFEASIAGDAESEAAKALSEWLGDAFWGANRMDAAQSTVHTQALAKGEAFGVIGWDNEAKRPTFAFNHPERMKAVYDVEHADRMLYAVKTWTTDEAGPSNPEGRNVERLNLYYPDRIERYFKLHNSHGRGGWERWLEQGDPDTDEPAAWPTPWVDSAGQLLGIPVVHFRNNAKGRPGGRSEIRATIPQQLLLDKQLVDLAMVLDAQGWPQRWAAGIEDASALDTAPGEIWVSGKADAKFGQFDTAEVTGVLAAIEATLSRIARRSGMPLHLLTTGAMPSGESIKASESRLVKRVKDRAATFGNAWEDAALVAVRIALAAGALPVAVDPDDLYLSTLWDDPVSRNEKEEAETAEAYHRLGVSKHTLLLRLGFDPEDEAARRKEEAEEAMAGMVVELMNGNGDRTEPPMPPRETPAPEDG